MGRSETTPVPGQAEGLLVIEANGRIRSANAEARRALGDEGPVVGVPLVSLLASLLDEDGRPLSRTELPGLASLSTGESEPWRLVQRQFDDEAEPDGLDEPSLRWLLTAAVPLDGGRGAARCRDLGHRRHRRAGRALDRGCRGVWRYWSPTARGGSPTPRSRPGSSSATARATCTGGPGARSCTRPTARACSPRTRRCWRRRRRSPSLRRSTIRSRRASGSGSGTPTATTSGWSATRGSSSTTGVVAEPAVLGLRTPIRDVHGRGRDGDPARRGRTSAVAHAGPRADRHGAGRPRRQLPARQSGAVRDRRLPGRRPDGADLPGDHPPGRPRRRPLAARPARRPARSPSTRSTSATCTATDARSGCGCR